MFSSGEGAAGVNPRVGAAAVLVLMVFGFTAVGNTPLEARARNNGFCKTRILRDYTGFLDALPPLPSPPIDEHLPFAPERVFFRSLGTGPLQAGAGTRGFGLDFSPFGPGSNDPSPVLDWQITSTLTSIGQQGQPLAPTQTIEQHVERLWPSGDGGSNEGRFVFDLPGEPAIYRLQIDFQNGNGELLATFGEYVRVLRPTLDFGFSLHKRRFRPGEAVRATLSNPGAAWLGFGLGRGIEFKQGTSWTQPPVEFPGGFVPAIGLILQPGESSSCWKVTIPKNAVPGRYRFTTGITVSRRSPDLSSTRRTVRAGFTILPDPKGRTSKAANRRTRAPAP